MCVTLAEAEAVLEARRIEELAVLAEEGTGEIIILMLQMAQLILAVAAAEAVREAQVVQEVLVLS